MIQIDVEMPKSCGGCPCVIYTAEEKKAIGYCNTSDEDYYCKALDRFMEYDKVDGGLDILGKPVDCPLKEVSTGKWERHYSRFNVYADLFWHCSVCGYKNSNDYANRYHKYCPNCGAKMVEPQESEDKE